MNSKHFRSIFVILLIFIPLSIGQTFPFVAIGTCQQDQFFNSANQQCESCSVYINGSQATTDSKKLINMHIKRVN